MNGDNKWIWIVGIVIVALIILSQSGFNLFSFATGNNMILNPSVETQHPTVNGTPYYWAKAGTQDTGHISTWDSVMAHSGSKSLKMEVANSNKSWFGWKYVGTDGSGFVPVEENKSYVVEYYFKTENVASGGSIGISIHEYDAQFKHVWCCDDVYISYSATQDWTRVVATRTSLTHNNTKYVNFETKAYITDGKVWMDDISLTEGTLWGTEIFPNKNLEEWTTTSATTFSNSSHGSTGQSGVPIGWNSQYGGTIQRSTDAYEGQYSVEMISNATTGDFWAGKEAAKLTQGHLYDFSAYIKTTANAKMFVQREDTWASIASVSSQGNGTWKKVSLKAVVSATLSQGYRLAFTLNSQPGKSMLIDKIEFIDLGTAINCTTISECGSTEECKNGYCMPMDCAAGYVPENHICVLGICTSGSTQGCLTSNTCTGTQICINNQWDATCVATNCGNVTGFCVQFLGDIVNNITKNDNCSSNTIIALILVGVIIVVIIYMRRK